MQKLILSIFFTFFGLLMPFLAQSQNFYLVHVTAYNYEQPSADYFKKLPSVTKRSDNKGLTHYFLSEKFLTLEAAQKAQIDVASKGYDFAYVVDEEKVRKECNVICGELNNTNYAAMSVPTPYDFKSIEKARHIFFTFGKSYLDNKAKDNLKKIASFLRQHDELRLELHGHCDAVGSDAFNKSLSDQRIAATWAYLSNVGVAKDKMKNRVGMGEEKPIAKNLMNGKDCVAGRQLNRRVEIFITDASGNILNDYVAPIEVPEYLADENGGTAASKVVDKK